MYTVQLKKDTKENETVKLVFAVYATTAGSPYVYRNCMVCIHMGDNNMRKPRPRFVFIPEGCSCAQNVAQW